MSLILMTLSKPNKSDTLGDLEKIDILSLEDEKIKSIGELLSNDTSREIMKTLFQNTMTVNQIAQSINLSLPLITYHLKKMQSMGLVKTVKVSVFDNEKHYTATKFVLVVFQSSVSDKAKRSKSLLNSLKRVYRFACVGVCALISWGIIQNMSTSGTRIPVGSGIVSENLFWSTTIPLLIIIGGLIVERFLSHKQRKALEN